MRVLYTQAMQRGASLGYTLGLLLAVGCGGESSVPGFKALNTTTTAGQGAGGATAVATGAGGDTTKGVAGVGGAAAAGGSSSVSTTGAGGAKPIGGDRPVNVHVPPGYNPSKPAPLLILLHGYSANGTLQEFYLDLSKEADERGYLFATPSGLKDKQGLNFWNATKACCNINGIEVDDSAYLRSLVEDVQGVFNVDPKRIYFAGHSNGGFMSHRMACDHADKVAAIASLAGGTHAAEEDCKPSEPVSVLNIHGTLDAVILYGGGKLLGNSYPGAIETSQRWAGLNGCSSVADTSPSNIDIEALLLGKETKVRRYDIGCKAQTEVELWSIVFGTHLPIFGGSFRKRVFDFFDAHPKP
jgi:polyhydroxybutyrate depolymerase